MASVSYHIANLLEKMTSSDTDFRFMATNDLMAELQKDSIKLDDDCERKVVKTLLKLLQDKNGEVQNLAVKCLGPLVNKVKEFQVETIVDSLCANMLSTKEQLRDISSIGLKTVISELAPSSTALAASICKKITGRLTSAIAEQEDVSVQLEALDILGDLLSRFGSLLITFHASIQEALLPQLHSARLAVRKRAIIAIGHLVMSCSDALFVELMDFLVTELTKNSSTSTTRTYIQCIGAISRQAGHRIGEHLQRIVPLIVRFCEVEDDELREYCIQAFESFVRRCPKEITPHVNTIITLCLTYLSYDPNYNYDDDDEESMEMEEEEEDEVTDDEYSDDDDMSWKVRRAAAKCLDAIVSTRHEMLSHLYASVSLALIARFKEREENVKADIFHAYISLLRQTRPIPADTDALDRSGGPVAMLQCQVAHIVKTIHRQLRERSIKTRQGCFSLLSELIQVLPSALAAHIPAIMPGILFSLGDKNTSSNMKIDTLAFLTALLASHSPVVFHPHIDVLVPPVVSAVGDPFYKITSEALLVTQQLVKVIRPLDIETTFDFRPYVGDLYECMLKRLRAADIDQEVKERAISCMGYLIYYMGDALTSQLPTCLPIFLERLKNEITRRTTVKALTMIARSPLKIDLRLILAGGIPHLASFLRKNHRALRLSTLMCLDELIKSYGTSMNSNMFSEIMKELPMLLTESDLHVSQLTLNLLTSICAVSPGTMGMAGEGVIPQLIVLVRSPLLQGAALVAMLQFFQALVATATPGLGCKQLLQMLTNPIYNPTQRSTSHGHLAVHKQAFQSIAKCIAALMVSLPVSDTADIAQFVSDIQNEKSTESVRLLALLALGEIGKYRDLSWQENIQSVIFDSFSSPHEEVKSAASYALGNVSIGNLQRFLPFVLQEISRQPKRQYLLLHSLKEIIGCQLESLNTLKSYVDVIWSLLMSHCECGEEGTRNVVAECLGRLTLVQPDRLLPRLRDSLAAPSPLIRATVVTAVKFTISDQPQPIDALLRNMIGDFLSTICDKDLNVRRVSLVAFNSAAHNKPSLIRELLPNVLPHLYSETKVRKELIREVEMGPFKHTVDDGLDIRKAAFECMYTLLDSCLDRLDIFEFLRHVESGLIDHYDIKMLTYLMLVRLSHLCPTAVLQHLDQIVEPLRATCTTKVKANSVKQEFEKQDELKRSAMRAVTALLRIPDADKNQLVNEFLSQIKWNTELKAMYESVQKDSSTAAAATTTASEMSLMDVSV